MKTVAILKYAFAVIGGGLVAAALIWANHVRGFIAQAAKAEGTVMELVASRSNDGGTTWKPVVRFTAPGGEIIHFTSRTSSNPPGYSKGEKVEVLYRPGQPQDASINGLFSLWGGPLIIGGIGAAFFLIGGGMIFAGRFAAQRAAWLRTNGMPVKARFQGVELNEALTVNGRHPFRVVAQWLDPATSEVHVFRSENLWFDPTEYIKSPELTVYIEQSNPKKYLVDVAFLPKLAS